MDERYRTAFEVSYFSNGTLLTSLGFLAVGLVLTVAAMAGKFRLKEQGGCTIAALVLWCTAWNSVSVLMLAATLRSGWTYTNALRNGRCEVVEGVVEVVHLEPKTGHDPGDRIRVAGREFQYSYFTGTLPYKQTVTHGGVLVDGANVRLHYLQGAILKVEVMERKSGTGSNSPPNRSGGNGGRLRYWANEMDLSPDRAVGGASPGKS